MPVPDLSREWHLAPFPGEPRVFGVAWCGGYVLREVPAYIPDRWLSRLSCVIDHKGTHWLMGGWNNGVGHAKARMLGKVVYCYRWVYEQVKGVKLGRLNWVDHKCERKPCINLEHLEAVTPGVNTYRGPGRFTQFKPAETPSPTIYGDPLDALDSY